MKNKNRNKSQSSLELVVIFVFVMLIISGVIYLIGKISQDVSERDLKADADNLAKNILAEFELMERVEGGYLRFYTIDSSNLRKFNRTFLLPEGYLIIEDILSSNGNEYYYSIPTNYDVEINFRDQNNDGREDMVLTLRKLY